MRSNSVRRRTSTAVVLVMALAVGAVPFALVGGCVYSSGNAVNVATQGSGVARTETRDVKEFRRIRLDGAAKIRVTIGRPQQLTLSGDDNILPLIDTTVDGDELRISSHGSYSPKLPLEVTITVPSLTGLDVRGSGDTTIDGLNEASFDVAIRGSGDVTAQGRADAMKVEVKGAGDVKLEDVQAKTAEVSISGSGNVNVNAADSLTVNIAGSGDVRYTGEPKEINKQIAGSGSVKRM